VDVLFLTGAAVERHGADDIAALLTRDDGLLWVDIPQCDEDAARVLTDVFGFHQLAVRECVERNRLPKVHAYADHVFVVLHEPAEGSAGHVHYVELDQFIGPNYLVTVHGPVNPRVDPEVVRRDVRSTVQRLESGRLRPSTPFELSYAVLSGMARSIEAFIEKITRDVWELEQQVVAGDTADPEELLEELFRARHGLLASRTMASLNQQMYGRMTVLSRFVPADAQRLVDDLADQFDRLTSLADGQREYLQGVIEFYRTRTETKMTIAAERLAVIAVVTLPITALASIYGMNVIVSGETDVVQLLIVLLVMATMSGWLLQWAKRQGWW
jgi:Mg2+ and Co2+ transporter CorA